MEFGSLPVVDVDGMRLAQTRAIDNYLGQKFKLIPDDLLMRHKGEKTVAYILGDIQFSQIFKAQGEKDKVKKAAMDAEVLKKLPMWFEMIGKLVGDTKYMCGDKICLYDFYVGGFFTNVILLEKINVKGMAKCFMDTAPENLKNYVMAYKAEPKIKAYLDKRAKMYPKCEI